MSHCWPLLLTEELVRAGEERACACPAEGWQFCLAVEGASYWLGRPGARELNAGELLVCGPGVQGELRASRINDARIRRFCFNPASLVGVFSLAERIEVSQLGRGAVEILPASHPAAQLVAGAPLSASGDQPLAGRAELLHAALLALAGRLPHPHPNGVRRHAASAEQRLQDLLAHAPDADLLAHTAEDIAMMCGCSVRHLNRLIRTELNCSIRVVQEEARLRRARELIEQTGGRVADIARAVGYGHVGQFNAAFKKLFRMTPSECRAACFRIVTSPTLFRHDPATK